MSVKYREYPAHCDLQDIVRCLWTLEMHYPPGSVQDVTPDGCVELIFNFGCPYVPLPDVPSEPPGAPLPTAFAVGFQNKTLRYAVDGTVRVVAARLFGWAAPIFLRDRVAHRIAPLDSEWGELSDSLRADVLGGRYQVAAGTLQGFLLRRAVNLSYDKRIIQAAAKSLHLSKGQHRIEELADHCRMSMRQLERGFNAVVGTSPKSFARTVRFQQAQRRLMQHPDTSLTRLAYDCGYADQAHFIKDFKAFAGKTPSEYADEIRSMREVLQSRDVVFLQ